MAKLLVLLVGVAMTWGLVASLGWVAIVACFMIALATVMFSIEADEQDTVPVSPSMEVSQQSF